VTRERLERHRARRDDAGVHGPIQYERWLVSERYLRDLYGDRVADRYLELREEERRKGLALDVGSTALAATS
jgi:hypothetical protein